MHLKKCIIFLCKEKKESNIYELRIDTVESCLLCFKIL